jgi:NADH dehydrogenase
MTEAAGLDAVTGAFSFTGQAIAQRLLDQGRQVTTLARRRHGADPFEGRIAVKPLALDDPKSLAASLAGVDTLYNTFWIRFPRGELTFDLARARSLRLVEAARQAGVRRLVHISVVNATESPTTPYFAAKAALERDIRASGLSLAIVRPTLTYGEGDILVNNLSWVLRRVPFFGVAGDGRYRLQPVHVEDVAAIAVEAGASSDDLTVDAAGPEIFEFDDFVGTLARAVGRRARLIHLPPRLFLASGQLIGLLLRDVVLTRDEVTELTDSLLVSRQPPAGKISFSEWVAANADRLGRRYHSELARHYR